MMIQELMRREWPQWACPDSGVTLEAQGAGEDRVLKPRSGISAAAYPVIGGIPRFVARGNYADSFGLQWNRFRVTQLDSHTGLPLTRERIRRCLGEEIWTRLPELHVLECGCGAGRFTEVLLGQGAAVTSLDLSSAVDANKANFPIGPCHRIAQADITKAPFAPQQFDVVFCLGVVQHTPDPATTIERLYENVRPGGWLVIDHYTVEPVRWFSVKPLFRAYLKRQPPARAMRIVDRLVDWFYPWHERFRDQRLAWTLLCRISPLTTYLRSLPELREDLQREWCVLDTHDSLTDWFKWWLTKEQVHERLASLGATEIHCEYGGNGVEARCRRPNELAEARQ